MIKIALEKRGTCHICLEMLISEPMRKIRVFEKDIRGYKSDSDVAGIGVGVPGVADVEIVEFEITDEYILGSRIFREVEE